MGEQQANQMPNLKAVVNYKCPNCDAPLGFDIKKQQWDCGFCGSEFNQSQINELDMQAGSTNLEKEWKSSVDCKMKLNT